MTSAVFRRNLLHPSSECIYAGDVNGCVFETSADIQQSAGLVSQKTVLLEAINYINPVVLLLSGWNWVPSWSCSQAVSKTVWHIPLLCVQY